MDACNGVCSNVADDSLVPPDDGNPCTAEACVGGVAKSSSVADDAACQVGGSAGKCVAGTCVVTCSAPADCDDQNPCTTDTCEATSLCAHAPVADGTATPGVTNDPLDCKKSVCKAGKASVENDATEVPDDGNECTTDVCGADGKAVNTKLTGPACAGGANVCVAGVCQASACGDGVLVAPEACDKTDLGGKTCLDFGFGGPAGLSCKSDCSLDTSGCNAVCGNGVVEGAEECDDPTTKGAAGNGCSELCTKEPAAGELVITEVMFDPTTTNDVGEYIEVYNASAGPLDLRGLRIARKGSTTQTHVITSATPLVLAAGAYAVLANSSDTTKNGGVTPTYTWNPTSAIQLANSSGPIEIRIEVASTPTLVVDAMSYPTSASYNGKSYSLKAGTLSATDNDTAANWCAAKTEIVAGGDLGTPGAANDCPLRGVGRLASLRESTHVRRHGL